MRVFIASVVTETNTFAPFPTGEESFRAHGLRKDSSRHPTGSHSEPLKVFRERAEAEGHDVVESLCAFAQPSGKTLCRVYETFRDAILDDLKAAGKVDVVLLMLHGAMVAEGYDDTEGDIIAQVRAVAPDAVIGVELDPHCHLTEAMVVGADLIVISKEYPHVDFGERAVELADLCFATARGQLRPRAALVDCRMIGFYPTLDSPMKDIVEALKAAEVAPLISVSLAHGFPWADVPEMGTRVLVYADDAPEAATSAAEGIAGFIYDQRQALYPDYPTIPTSLARAAALDGRVVLGDFADNPGGGAPGDSTFFLREMLALGIRGAVVGVFWDPFVASICADAGVGARLPIRLGGKCGRMSGDPLDLVVEVMGVVENHTQGVYGQRESMGRSVWLRAHGNDIAVCSVRTQTYDPDAFSGLGMDLDGRRLLVVKSSNHYRAGFDAVADHLWHVASPGTMTADLRSLPYTRLTGPWFPKIDDPWAEAGPPKAKVFHG